MMYIHKNEAQEYNKTTFFNIFFRQIYFKVETMKLINAKFKNQYTQQHLVSESSTNL